MPKLRGLILAIGLISNSCLAGINWKVTFEDEVRQTGRGFDDPAHGLHRRRTISRVLEYVDSVIDADGRGEVFVASSRTSANEPLAQGGTFFPDGPAGFYGGYLFEHLTTGVDPDPGRPDAVLAFNFFGEWNCGTTSVLPGEHDLFAIALHEMTHALGWLSLLDGDGRSVWTGSNPGVFSEFDRHLAARTGDSFQHLFRQEVGRFSGATGVLDGLLTSRPIYFMGAHATEANGDTPLRVFSEAEFVDGVSLSHLDPRLAWSNSAVMHPAADGTGQRTFRAEELAVLRDLGYRIVPEPTCIWNVYAALLLLTLHRRRQTSKTSRIPSHENATRHTKRIALRTS